MKSQNGWTASADPEAINVGGFTVAGVAFPNGVRRGDVGTVLRYVAETFHRTVEPLHLGWCWGYYYKPIEGSSTLSNHASGTAIDLNAPAHPMGRRDTFPPARQAAIRRILTYLEGAVRWGGDYTTRPDDMHFEINASPLTVARVAAKIRRAATLPTNGETSMDLTLDDVKAIRYTDGRMLALATGTDTVRADLTGGGEPVWIVQTVKELDAKLDAIGAKLGILP